MKWILLLALVVSCTTHKSGEVTPTNEPAPIETTTPTESDAKPVSPLTVQPCFCMKIFQPVCANNVNYGNSCEAECHGNKTWKDGYCGGTKKK